MMDGDVYEITSWKEASRSGLRITFRPPDLILTIQIRSPRGGRGWTVCAGRGKVVVVVRKIFGEGGSLTLPATQPHVWMN